MIRTKPRFIAFFCALWAFGGSALAGDSPLFSKGTGDAPAGVKQYGQFEGRWTCAPEYMDSEGNWQILDARPQWVWHYVLDGAAVQDVWLPDSEKSPPGAAKGTNLRVYDTENDEWDMVWTTETSGRFQHFTAKMIEGEIVMRGDIPAGQRPAHRARITFHNISHEHFDWKYEASSPNGGTQWQLFSSMSCQRDGAS